MRAILPLSGPDTRRIDLDGHLMVPGFIDTHIHFYEWALKRQGVKLDNTTSLEDLLEPGQGKRPTAIQRTTGSWARDSMRPNGPPRKCPPGNASTKWRRCIRCCSGVAICTWPWPIPWPWPPPGIEAATPDPPDGRIERDESGEPNGILRELAINLVRQAIPPHSTEGDTASPG